MPAPFRERSQKDSMQAPPVFFPWERTWPDLKSPRLSAPGSVSWIQNDFERVVFPQHPSLAEIKRILAASDTPEAALRCLAVRVRFSALRVVPDPGRCGSGLPAAGRGGGEESVDAHPAPGPVLAGNVDARGALTFNPCARETRHRLSRAKPLVLLSVGRSSNGRTVPFGGTCLGSNPSRPAKSPRKDRNAAKANQLGGIRRWKWIR